MAKTFHIRAPMPRKEGGNQFYGPTDVRVPKTLCGDPITSFDIEFRWQAYSVHRYVCCEECMAIRQQSRKAVKR